MIRLLLAVTLCCSLPQLSAAQELEFLPQSPAGAPHRQEMQVLIDAQSLKTGLVRVDQCHYRLDPVPATQIVFGPALKALQVTRSRNISSLDLEGRSVQLHDVGENAEICLRTVNQVFRRQADGSFVLRNGPFMRQFLDGYFPLQLQYQIRYPASLLVLESLTPEVPATAFKSNLPGKLDLQVLFTGPLQLETRFRPLTP